MAARFSLSRVLQIDALSCIACALPMLAASQPLAALTGLGADFLWSAGAVLTGFTLLFGWLGILRTAPPMLVLFAIAGNIGWIVASFAVLLVFAEVLTPAGSALIVAQAFVTGLLAFGEASGLRTQQALHA